MGLFKVNDIFFSLIAAKLFSNSFQLTHVGLDVYLIKSWLFFTTLIFILFLKFSIVLPYTELFIN